MKWILSLVTLFCLVAYTDAGPLARFRGGRGGCSGGSCGSGSCGSAAVAVESAPVQSAPVPLTGLPPLAPQAAVLVEAPGVSVGVQSEGRVGRRHIFPIFHRRGCR